MPASLTSAMACPSPKAAQDGGPHFCRIVLVIGHEPGADAVAFQELGRGARVLAQQDIHSGHGGQRPQA